jgi:hypothetical protein
MLDTDIDDAARRTDPTTAGPAPVDGQPSWHVLTPEEAATRLAVDPARGLEPQRWWPGSPPPAGTS